MEKSWVPLSVNSQEYASARREMALFFQACLD